MNKYVYKIFSTIKGNIAEQYSEHELIGFYNTKISKNRYIKLLITGDNYEKKYNNGSIDSFIYCHNYALKIDDIETCEEGLEILEDNYTRISLSQLKQGDIITFFDEAYADIDEDNIYHFGIVKRTDNTLKGTIIISKWGREGVFETNLYSLPDFYGTKVCFWRKRGRK